MKKKMTVFLMMCLPVLLTACFYKVPEETEQTPNEKETIPIVTVSGNEEMQEATIPETKETIPDTDPWKENRIILGNPVFVTSNEEQVYSCNVDPDSDISTKENYTFVKSTDGFYIVMAVADEEFSEQFSLDDAFGAYLDTFEEHYDSSYLILASDYQLEIKEQDPVTINGRIMVKVRGTMTFLENDRYDRFCSMLGYATELSDGRYALWVGFNRISEDYVQFKDCMENMAYSFEEVNDKT